jgi:HNH endonuclease
MLTQERLKYLLEYNPATGEWLWLNPPNHNTRMKGKLAGNRRRDGYLLIRIGGQLYYSSRLAFLYMLGRLPADEVDHIDRDPSNDKWINLREATSSQNKYNRETYRKGFRGVYPSGNKWIVMVGRDNYLGTYETYEEAVFVRDSAASQIAGPFAVLNSQELTQ